MSLEDEFAAEVEDWRRRGLGRSLERRAAEVDFTSSDTLGLAGHPALVAAARDAVERFGVGGRAARLLGGGSAETEQVEARVAGWLGAEAALMFPSGYQANVTLLPAIAGPGDVIISDALNHASLIDAMRLARAEVLVARHGDVDHVRALLQEARGARRVLVVTEAVFSMDGDAAPLTELGRLCAESGAGLVVDEAHAIGVVGPRGQGGFAASGADPAPLTCRIVTCGKALGVVGAFLVGSRALIDLLVHRGRGFVFSTAVSPAVVGALGASIELVQGADDRRATVRGHASGLASALGLPSPAAAIVPVPIGDDGAAVEASARLFDSGIDVRAVRPPTVPPGTARLRAVCRADHAEGDIRRLVDGLRAIASGAPAGGLSERP